MIHSEKHFLYHVELDFKGISPLPYEYNSLVDMKPLRQTVLNSLAPGRCASNFASVYFKLILRYISCEIVLRWHSSPHWSLVNIGPGNGLATAGKKLLAGPMLTEFYDAIWRHSHTCRPQWEIIFFPQKCKIANQITKTRITRLWLQHQTTGNHWDLDVSNFLKIDKFKGAIPP